jgi:hypothetical protein
LQGPVQQWTDELTELVVGYGFDTFLLWAESDEQLERFAQEVVPAAVNNWPPRPADRRGTPGAVGICAGQDAVLLVGALRCSLAPGSGSNHSGAALLRVAERAG